MGVIALLCTSSVPHIHLGYHQAFGIRSKVFGMSQPALLEPLQPKEALFFGRGVYSITRSRGLVLSEQMMK